MSLETVFCASGDCFLNRMLPEYPDDAFKALIDIIGRADVRITNLETTVHRQEGYPAAASGGTWAIADPSVLSVLKQYNFNLVSWANNHTLDYSHGGLLATAKALDEAAFIHAGAGENLAAASAPRYLECSGSRVSFLAACSTYTEGSNAGEQRSDSIGRPGVNPLRYKVVYSVSSEQLRVLQDIADITNLNAENDLAVAEGFKLAPEEGLYRFGEHLFRHSDSAGRRSYPLKADLNRMIGRIKEARRQSDYVMLSIHSHEMRGSSKDEPDYFFEQYARECIEAGADAVIGHGPHVLRGIEIYQGRPIFYSLGNFIFHTETVRTQPHDQYEKYGVNKSQSTVADALAAMAEDYTRGLCVNPDVWEAVLPLWRMDNGHLKELLLYPIELGYELPIYRMGWPKISRNSKILERLARLSKDYGTDIDIADGVGRVVL